MVRRMTTPRSGEPQDPLARLPGYVLRRASAALLGELNQRLAPLKLRHADAAFLLLLQSTPGMTQSDAGRLLDIQRANMVPLVARLEKRGLIDRKRADGRSHALSLSSVGRALARKVSGVVGEVESALLERVPAALRPMVMPVLLALWGQGD
jgi:DNA-binding MarR family transcriptional regulator